MVLLSEASWPLLGLVARPLPKTAMASLLGPNDLGVGTWAQKSVHSDSLMKLLRFGEHPPKMNCLQTPLV